MSPPRPYWTGTLARQGEHFVWEMQDPYGWTTTGTVRAELQPDGSRVWRMEGHIGPPPDKLTNSNLCAKACGTRDGAANAAPGPNHGPGKEVHDG